MANPAFIDTAASAVFAQVSEHGNAVSVGAIAEILRDVLTTEATAGPTGHNDDRDDPLLPPWQAGVVVGLSPSTLAKRRMDGTGPVYVRLSATRVAYRRSALDAWLAARERTSTGGEARS